MNNLQSRLVNKEQAIEAIITGKVGVIPTDTVYGIVASAHNQAAVERLYALKSRERKPGTIIAASTDQLLDLGVDKKLLDLTVNLWPGPVSIILPVGEQFSHLHQGVGDIAIRVVDDAAIQSMLERTGPLLTSSANQPGQLGSVTIEQAWDHFTSTVDFYLDGAGEVVPGLFDRYRT